MSKVEKKYNLLLAIINQLQAQNGARGIKWDIIAQEIGLQNAAAASMRWTRFKRSVTAAPRFQRPKTSCSTKKQNSKSHSWQDSWAWCGNVRRWRRGDGGRASPHESLIDLRTYQWNEWWYDQLNEWGGSGRRGKLLCIFRGWRSVIEEVAHSAGEFTTNTCGIWRSPWVIWAIGSLVRILLVPIEVEMLLPKHVKVVVLQIPTWCSCYPSSCYVKCWSDMRAYLETSPFIQ